MKTVTFEEKKAFALAQIKPYYKDPSICAYNPEVNNCEYLTRDGRMCVVGKNLTNPGDGRFLDEGISKIIEEWDEEMDGPLFKPEARDMLISSEWEILQKMHDDIARDGAEKIEELVEELELFTMEELESE